MKTLVPPSLVVASYQLAAHPDFEFIGIKKAFVVVLKSSGAACAGSPSTGK
jgi:hypothetical protein